MLVWKAVEAALVGGEASLGIIVMVVLIVVLIVVLGVVRDGVVEVTLRWRRRKVISWAGVAGVALELRTTRIIVARIRKRYRS